MYEFDAVEPDVTEDPLTPIPPDVPTDIDPLPDPEVPLEDEEDDVYEDDDDDDDLLEDDAADADSLQ